ncbi:MAG: biotin--[acetyl-CoA-carboxylase] ligase, partial [Flavobacteriaceae bacterium]|nr:biotin--[acetyl-CoA-carboxylase] ligase [Flavobacteriaceae bacterium]
LNAIDSTNEYIKINKSIFDKELVCIYTFNQTMGKGQRGRNWESEPYKNLCVSFYQLLSKKASKDIFFKLNMIVSLKMICILKKYSIPKLSIKWPNDILSENKKIAGILIESSLKNNRLNDLIIGIGLNVNQTEFHDLLNASSLKKIMEQEFDLNKLIKDFIKEFSDFNLKLDSVCLEDLKVDYLKNLYGTNSFLKYQYKGSEIMGKIVDVKSSELIKIMVNNIVSTYNLKDLKLIY